MTEHQKGLILTCLGGLVLSFDIPLLRLGEADVWSAMATRSLATFSIAMLAVIVIRRFFPATPPLFVGWTGLVVAVLYGVSSVLFMLAVFNTSTANVAFILAFNPMFGALLSWLFMGERPAGATLLAMAAMLGGLVLIVGDGLEAGHAFGDGMAVLSALTSAGAITLSRAHGGNFGFAPLFSTFVPAAVSLWFVSGDGYRAAEPGWIIFNGLVATPIASYLLAIGPRRLPAAEVGMFYLLETILAPIWVWLLFFDRPSNQVLLGGLIVLLALFCHSLWTMRTAPQALRPGR